MMNHGEAKAGIRAGRTRWIRAIVFLVAAAIQLSLARGSFAAPPTIRLGMVPQTFAESIPFIAQQQGFFEKHGVKVEISHFRGDILTTRALLTGQIDVGSIGSYALINAIQKGADLRAFFSPVPEQPHHLVALKEIKGWGDLPGRTFGISEPGAISQTFPQVIMARKGVDPSKVNYLAIGGIGARQQAILADRVDATLLHMERAFQTVHASDRLHIVSSIAEELPGVALVYYAASAPYLRENEDTIRRFTLALVEASRFALTNKEPMIEFGLKVGGRDARRADVEAAYEGYRRAGVWDANGGLNKAGYEFAVNLGVETGALSEPLPFDRAIDSRFVEAALAKVGRVESARK